MPRRGERNPRPAGSDQAPERRARDRLRTSLSEGSARLEAARLDHPVIDAGFQVVSRDRLLAGGLLASAVAFRVFLWIVPLAVVFVSVFGFYSAADPSEAADLADDLGVTAFITGSVSQALEASGRGRWLALTVGLIALAWASRSLAVSLRAVHALAWEIRPVPPIIWTAPAVVAVSGLMAGIASVFPMVSWLRDRSLGFGLIGMGASILLFAAFWTLASSMLPRPADVPVRALMPGALLVGTVVELLHVVSILYLPGRFDRASSTYGALGVAVAALAWLYFSGRAVVAGAVLNVTLWDRSNARNGTPPD
jgi:uncharacterized BrkB/YihY/UPF0761 family membrane protein